MRVMTQWLIGWHLMISGAGAVRQLSEEVIPTLEAPQGVDVRAYGEEVLRRFTNPALGHTTQKVGTDGSQKLGPRLLGRVQGATAPEGVVRSCWGRPRSSPPSPPGALPI